MLQIASSVAIISLIVNIICNGLYTSMLMNLNLEDFLKDPPKRFGYIIIVALVSKYSFYLGFTVTIACLISRHLL